MYLVSGITLPLEVTASTRIGMGGALPTLIHLSTIGETDRSIESAGGPVAITL